MKRLALLALLLVLCGCSSTPPPPTAPPPVSVPDVEPQPAPVAPPPVTQPAKPAEPTPGEELQAAEDWDAQARAALGEYSRLLSSGRVAVEPARKALALKPDLASAQYHLGLALVASGQAEEALSVLAPLAKAYPEAGQYQTALGITYIGLKRFGEAAEACRRGQSLISSSVGATSCLTELGADFPPLPEGEWNFGLYQWQGDGYRYTGPERTEEPEFIRIHPNEYCGWRYADGFALNFHGCGRPGDQIYAWSFQAPFAGKSPMGIGIGSTYDEVVQAWGQGAAVGRQDCYAGEGWTLCFSNLETDQVTHIGLSLIEMDQPARALASEGY